MTEMPAQTEKELKNFKMRGDLYSIGLIETCLYYLPEDPYNRWSLSVLSEL